MGLFLCQIFNVAPALSVYTERVWGFFYAKFFRRGCVIFLTLRGRFTPVNVKIDYVESYIKMLRIASSFI